MATHRRNVLSRADGRVVAGVSGLTGILAALSGCRPTGQPVADAALCFALAATVAWASATAPWWALVAAAGVATASTLSTPWLLVPALVAAVVAVAIGVRRANLGPARAVVGGVVVLVLLRSEWDPFFAASALVSGAVFVLLVATGVRRRPGDVRSRVATTTRVLVAVTGVALAGLVVAGLVARPSAADGYDRLTDGLALLRSGDTLAAASALREAATLLDEAGDRLDRPWTIPARAVPLLAQHQAGLTAVVADASAAAADAAAALDVIDVDQFRAVDGVIDVEAISLLAGPVGDLQHSMDALADSLVTQRSPWLLPPFQRRFDEAGDLVADVARQTETARTAVEVGPSMLGVDGPRRWMVAFTSPAEARGQTGVMGNWAEITVESGRLRLTAQGRTNDLSDGIAANQPVRLEAPAEFFERYGPHGAGEPDTTVRPKFWSNVTMSPDTPTVGSAMAQMYEAATGRAVDGVLIVDPAAVAGVLAVTGPVALEEQDVVLDEANAESFLLLDQYEREESEREDLLEAATTALVDQVLATDLPGPQVLGRELGPAAQAGHLSGYAVRPAEQRLFERLGMSAPLPPLEGHDGLAVVANNAAGNKIDSFARREVRYEGRYDASTGLVEADLSVTLDNTAPAQGYPDYVIGNLIGEPAGSNRMLLSVYSPLGLTGGSIDGRPIDVASDTELGWNVYTTTVQLGPGDTATVEFSLAGLVEPGDYRLVIRPQPLATPERFRIEIENSRGAVQAGLVGVLRGTAWLDTTGLTPALGN